MKINKNFFITVFGIGIFCSIVASLPPSFGKTHFIIGADSDFIKSSSGRSTVIISPIFSLSPNEKINHVFFTPDQNVKKILLALLEKEKKSIDIAAFLLTDIAVAKALVAAHKRGVKVRVVTDHTCCKSSSGKVKIVYDAGIPVYVYQGASARKKMSDIMHNKFIVFGENIFKRSIVWTGSYNFTNSAQLYNQENVILSDSFNIIKRFSKKFNNLISRCVNCAPQMFPLNQRKKETKKVARTPDLDMKELYFLTI